MRSLFEKLKKYALLRSIIYILLGAAIIYDPIIVLKWILYIIAAYFALIGIISIITAISKIKEEGLANFDFISGIILVLVGICIVAFAVQISLFIHVLMGILVVVSGSTYFAMGLDVQKSKIVSGVPLMIFSIIVIVAGVLLLVNPFGTQALLFRIFAVALIIMGIGEIVSMITYRKIKPPKN